MYERFTDRTRRVVVLSQEEARLLSHDYIGTEHLLLALLHEGVSPAFQALESLGVTLERGRKTVEALIGRGADKQYVGHSRFTPRAKKTMELSLHEAIAFSNDGIHPEHILLGIIREGSGVAYQSLVKMGVDPQRLKARLMVLITDAQLPPETDEEYAQQVRFFNDLTSYPATKEAYEVLRDALKLARGQSRPLDASHLEEAMKEA